jgi:hypothetical protein
MNAPCYPACKRGLWQRVLLVEGSINGVFDRCSDRVGAAYRLMRPIAAS